MFSGPMNIKQKMALAIKAKQKAANPMGGPTPGTPPSSPGSMQASPSAAPAVPKSQPPLFEQGAKALNPHFFRLQQKLRKF